MKNNRPRYTVIRIAWVRKIALCSAFLCGAPISKYFLENI